MHPFGNKTIEEVETDIMRTVKREKPTGFNLDFLKQRLGETCPYESLEKALDSLIKKRKVIQNGYDALLGNPLYDVVKER